MNKTKNKIIYALISGYLGILVMFIICVYNTPHWVYQYEERYVGQVEQLLYETIKTTPQTQLVQEVEKLQEEYPLEIAIYSQTELLYRSLPGEGLTTLFGSLSHKAILLETQGDINTDFNQTYHCWYAIYPPVSTNYMQVLMYIEIFLLALSFIILLTIIYLLQSLTIKPLAQARVSLENLSNYNFKEISQNSSDMLNEQVQNFAVSLEKNMQVVSREYSQLEQDLQLEKERLTNLLTITRGLIHDLKTPIHQTVLENELLFQNEYSSSEKANEVIAYNIKRSEKVIFQINTALQLFDQDIQSMMEVTNTFDIIEMYKNIRNSFVHLLEKKLLIIDAQVNEKLAVHLNKIAIHLIIHNLLSNAIKYAVYESEIELLIEQKNQALHIRCINEATKQDIQRIQKSEALFYPLKEEDNNYIYSTGNGVYLIKELVKTLTGTYNLVIEKPNMVIVEIIIPMNDF